MEILLHHDYLKKALSSKEESTILKLCQTGRCKGWIASTTIQNLWQGLGKDKRNKIKPLLAHLSVVTPTARDLEDALQDDDFEEKLALILSRSCGFDAVVSTMPENFSNNESFGAITTTGIFLSTNANGPCFNSPAG